MWTWVAVWITVTYVVGTGLIAWDWEQLRDNGWFKLTWMWLLSPLWVTAMCFILVVGCLIPRL
jgi:hypothetical protein